MEQENPKKFLVFKIITFVQESTNAHILEHDTCHWHSIFYHATLRFKISLRESYSKAGSLSSMENIIKVLS